MSKSTPNILSNIAKRGLIKEYALFLKIKRLHKNSVIYKPKKLHEKLNCSRTKVRRILGIIISEGWGYYSKGNLVLNSAETIHYNLEYYKPKNYIKVHSVEDIYIELLNQKLRQQKFVKDKISDLKSNSGKSKKAIKFFKGEKGFIKDEQIKGDIGTGLETLSIVLGYSEGHTGYLMRYLNSCGLIEIKRREPKLIDFTPNLNIKYIPKGYFLKNNTYLYKRLTNVITIPEL